MSPQMEMLRDLIASAKVGNVEAIGMLRAICTSAPAKALVPDLVTMAQCLLYLGTDKEIDGEDPEP